MSELTKRDMDFLSEKKIEWSNVKLKRWHELNAEDLLKLDKGNNVTVVDMTNEHRVKLLSRVDRYGLINIKDMTNRHLVHRRCNTPVTIKGNHMYCDKCRRMIPKNKNSVRRWSNLRNDYVKTENVLIGLASVGDMENPIILVDLDYIVRCKIDHI